MDKAHDLHKANARIPENATIVINELSVTIFVFVERGAPYLPMVHIGGSPATKTP